MRSQYIFPLFLISVSQAIPQYKHHTLKARYDVFPTDDSGIPSDGDNLEIASTGSESNGLSGSNLLGPSQPPSSTSNNGDGDITGEFYPYNDDLFDPEDKAAKKQKPAGRGDAMPPAPNSQRPPPQVPSSDSPSPPNQPPPQAGSPDGSGGGSVNGVPIEHSNEPFSDNKAHCETPPGTQCEIVDLKGKSYPAHQEYNKRARQWMVCPEDRKLPQVGCVYLPGSGPGGS